MTWVKTLKTEKTFLNWVRINFILHLHLWVQVKSSRIRTSKEEIGLIKMIFIFVLILLGKKFDLSGSHVAHNMQYICLTVDMNTVFSVNYKRNIGYWFLQELVHQTSACGVYEALKMKSVNTEMWIFTSLCNLFLIQLPITSKKGSFIFAC